MMSKKLEVKHEIEEWTDEQKKAFEEKVVEILDLFNKNTMLVVDDKKKVVIICDEVLKCLQKEVEKIKCPKCKNIIDELVWECNLTGKLKLDEHNLGVVWNTDEQYESTRNNKFSCPSCNNPFDFDNTTAEKFLKGRDIKTKKDTSIDVIDEICCECGKSTKIGSGRFLYRIPITDDFEVNKALGRAYPNGRWLCKQCDIDNKKK